MNAAKLFVVVLLVAALAGCAKPLPPERAAYAGEWKGTNMSLLISQAGTVQYQRVDGNMSESIHGPIQEFSGAGFSVGVGPLSADFKVTVPPHQDGEAWKMTVDGVELTRS